MPTNPYSDWIYGTNQKVAKKRKKLPFGNFLDQNLCSVQDTKVWTMRFKEKTNPQNMNVSFQDDTPLPLDKAA